MTNMRKREAQCGTAAVAACASNRLGHLQERGSPRMT
jgi:hypothetical protein